jgi:diguanylate cyclase (GGDEF)-like protein
MPRAMEANLGLIVKYLKADKAAIYVYEEQEQLIYPLVIMSVHGEMDPEAAISVRENTDSYFSQALRAGETIVAEGHPECGVYAPIVKDGARMGVLKVDNFISNKAFTARQIREIEEFVEPFRQGMNNCGTYQRFHAQIKKLTTLTKIAGIMATALRLEEILKITLNSLVRDMGYDRAHIYLMDERSRKISKMSSYDIRDTFKPLAQAPESLTAIGTFLIEKVPSFLSRRFSSDMIAYTPIYWKGRKIGILVVDNLFSRQMMTADDLSFLGILGNQLGILIENSRLFEKVEQFSMTDGLTGLYNHRHFYNLLSDEMARADRSRTKLSLLMCDIDHFKKFNDTYGHQAGDKALKVFAETIKKSVRTIDVAARYGGEEFAVLLPSADTQRAVMIADRICENLRKTTLVFNRRKARITASIGVATYPDDSEGKTELVRKADKALYWSKEKGRDRVSTYSGTSTGQAGKS